MKTSLAALALLLAPLSAHADDKWAAPLPPVPPWEGRSRDRIVAVGHPWITPSESAGFRTTPSYDETVAWLQRLDVASDRIALTSIGRSAEGREIWMVVASATGAATAEAVRAEDKPVLLAQAGIHGGEIDGKDAGLMLLRDVAFADAPRAALLDRATFLFVPILNVDGHERVSPYNRINQRGPENAGWRTNARNQNLNRDYTKLDTEEVRAVVAAIQDWGVDLYLDLHVTDGGDHQYDITFGGMGPNGHSPETAEWVRDMLGAGLSRDLAAEGHVPGPLWVANWTDPRDPAKGFRDYPASARFSHCYADTRQLAALLVENHSLKPYDRRVLGTHVLLESALRTLAERSVRLRGAAARDALRRPVQVPVQWRASPPAEELVKAVDWTFEPESTATGAPRLRYTGEPVERRLTVVAADAVAATVQRPKAYWIPAAWTEVIERLRRHGIATETLVAPREVEVETCRLDEAPLVDAPNEGRVGLAKVTCRWRKQARTFGTGAVRVDLDQPLGALAVLLLDPASTESLLHWGFFNGVLQRTEYVEEYVMAPLAERVLAADARLRAQFEAALKAMPELAADPAGRLAWFYARSPWADPQWRIYPVARER